jgi:renal tumor antigen
MLYELLTMKPLFPGKHEIDQIGRIHNILGTPTRDLLAQFKQNPNTQISFAFPQRVPQDLRKIMPRGVSQGTIDLLAGLLTYNPRRRLASADALNFDCFTAIREAEREWEQLEITMAFPLYFLQRSTFPKSTIIPNDLANPRSAVPETVNISGANDAASLGEKKPEPLQSIPSVPKFVAPENLPVHNEPAYAAPGPELVISQPVYRPPQEPAPIPTSVVLQPSVVKPLPGLAAPKPGLHPLDAALIESRIKAAQRIKAYQDAAKAKKPKKPVPFHGAAFQFASSKGLFPKPHPDLVEPRLPKLMF